MHRDFALLSRAVGEPDPRRLTSAQVRAIQRLIGNHAARAHIESQAGAGSLIARWPAPEANDQPDPGSFRMFKCHDAVVYWVLRSLDLGPEEATTSLKLLQQKKGPSAGWIVEALGYGGGARINGPDQAGPGDILFTGATSYVAHTMVVLDADNIRGFNNYGTFGTEGGGDQFSVENFAAAHFWHDVEGGQMGTGPEASFPVYRLDIGAAQAALRGFVGRVSRDDPDYDNPMMNVGGVNVAAMKKKKGCYITTAVTLTRGLPDDCDELETLRRFRDEYLLSRPNGPYLVRLYYAYAPLILEAIAGSSDAGRTYSELYDVIRDCVRAIKTGQPEMAYETYCEMVIKLKDRFIPSVEMPDYEI